MPKTLARPLPACIWANPLRTTPSELSARLERQGIHQEPLPWLPYGFRIREETELENQLAFAAGLYHVQAEAYLTRENGTASAKQLERCTGRGYVRLQHEDITLGVGFLTAAEHEATVRSLFPKAWKRSPDSFSLCPARPAKSEPHRFGCVDGPYRVNYITDTSEFLGTGRLCLAQPSDSSQQPAPDRRAMRYHLLLFLSLLLLVPSTAWAQQTEPIEGLRDNTPRVHALTGATIVVAPGEVLENATLVIRDGMIEEIGAGVSPPSDARIWDLEGKTLYSGFIDPSSSAGMPEEPPEDEEERGLRHWNDQVQAHQRATDLIKQDGDEAKKLRAQGFTAANIVPPFGIFQGQTSVLSSGEGAISDRTIENGVAQAVSLRRSEPFSFSYPTSPIGAMSFIRQILHDADWYERAHETYRSNPQGVERPETNPALAALVEAAQGEQPLLFHARNEEEVLRSLRIAEEFTITPWIRGSGHEYRILDVLTETGVPLILPVAFPEAPEVGAPEDALDQSLADLRHWYQSVENPARLAEAGRTFSFTADGLEEPGAFLKNVRKAIERGLDKETALAAMTTNPAALLGLSATHGTLEPGKHANIVVADGDLLEDEASIVDVWVDGERFEINGSPEVDPRGQWRIASTDGSFDATLELVGDPSSPSGTIRINGQDVELSSASLRGVARRLRVRFPGDALGESGPVQLSASVLDGELHGWGTLPGGERFGWEGERTAPPEEEADDSSEENGEEPLPELNLADIRPAMEYGRQAPPEQPEHVVVRGATVWTMGPEGVLEEADLLISGGEVVEIGANLQVPAGAQEIDAAGKHVTPGLIDAHLHSGLFGVNEIGSAVVPEVQMGDVLTINNIWMYRQLAGGLTTAHVMHGSANPIGGQNEHIKMRWGSLPEALKIEGAPRTVKFALGENPKRVGSDRYPDTRMGTEQVIRDHFRAALDYRERWNEWEETGAGLPPRRDLRMEALLGILDGEILIQSHSYRQDEILMLMRLAEEFDLQVKAFHHGVETYKVAPELAEHGAGAVVWSDWSSFKIEAYDATTYNARLLNEAGVLTSLHSDNSQISSRMNWEAAKMVRAGMSEEDALALVTINTAELLGIDERVGSLEPGKDADFVIWNNHPLSTTTRAEETWIDGRKYFDLDDDREHRRAIEEERSLLIERILEEQ